jgi:hypothetical protein
MNKEAKPYRPSDGRARFTIFLFWTFVALSTLMMAVIVCAAAIDIDLYAEDMPNEDEPLAFANILVMVQGLGALAYFAVLIGCMIAFLCWIHRARANLSGLGAIGARWSPAWAVIWWFIPFMSLVRPYEVVKEIWQASDPGAPPTDWQQRDVPSLLGWWWGFFLAWSIADRVAERIYRDVERGANSGLVAAEPVVDIAILGAGVLSAYLAIRIVREITSRQTQRAHVNAFL